jgi:HSP20 family protein
MRLIRYTYPNTRRFVDSSAYAARAPWTSFERDVERLVASALGQSAPDTGGNTFPLDLYRDEKNSYVRAELPGVAREDIKVEVADETLTITAARKTPASGDQSPAQSVTLSRSLSLHEAVQSDQIAAAYENGVLTVTLPRRVKAQPQKITVPVK